MQKTDLTTIDRQKEPNLYRFCEWANAEIDKGMMDIKVPMVGDEERAFARFTGQPIPERKPITREQFAEEYMRMIDAPSVPITDIL